MRYSFHPEAEAELNDAVDYYQKQQANLGLEFAKEVHSAIQRILAFPNAWQLLEDDIRRCMTRRFPFGIIYYERIDTIIIILAIMQLNRKPGYWQKRKNKQ